MILLLVILTLLITGALLDRSLSLRQFLTFFVSAIFSLVVLFILLLVLAGLGQGVTLIVKLFFNWPNTLLTLVLINFLALILSHFPHYFEIALSNRPVKWQKFPEQGPLGYVYHTGDNHREALSIRFIRRHIGIICYVIWIYILLTVKQEIFKTGWNITLSAGACWLILSGLQLYLEKETRQVIKWLTVGSAHLASVKKKIRILILVFELITVLSIVLTVLFLFSIGLHKWSLYNLNYFIWLTMLYAAQYLLFRSTRPFFVYYALSLPGNPKDCFPRHRLLSDFRTGIFKPFRYFSNHIYFLVCMSGLGISLTVLLILLNLTDVFLITYLNPVPLLMSWIILYYSAAVIGLKHFIYSRARISFSDKKHRPALYWPGLVNRFLSACLLLCLLFPVLAHYMNNSLHTLDLVEYREEGILQKEDFLNDLNSDHRALFLMASYGGGLKAHLWNFLILNELHERNPYVFDQFICLSGVSGGAIGINSFISGLYTGAESTERMDYLADTIGNSNTLSIDINGLFFRDLVREPLPEFLLPPGASDRSQVSMLYYADLFSRDIDMEMDVLYNMEIRTLWKEIYNRKGWWPAVIYNTTPTSPRYGVACSVSGFDNFPVSVDILDHGTHSLSLFESASTSNRFPVFSPAARIPGKGHFVDGGYFENSGLMNALSFYEQVHEERPDIFERANIYTINVINDKALYIIEHFGDQLKGIPKDAAAGELISILQGIVALERMPNMMRHRIVTHPDSLSYLSLHMPYWLEPDEIAETLMIDASEDILVLQNIADRNNKDIEYALEQYPNYHLDKWGIVTPPLGRLLSIPAREYQKAMICCHPAVRERLDSIESMIVTRDQR